MNLVSIRLITADVKALAHFYQHVTGVKAIFYTDDFAELQTPNGTLAIGSTRTLQLFGGNDVAAAAQNRSAIIEFLSPDLDADFERLAEWLGDAVVQKPTLMPWGNRSLLFRDPDGNLVNLFTPQSAEAIRKFERVM
jgi:predicted enzyme related to lactoylglutathione lyase